MVARSASITGCGWSMSDGSPLFCSRCRKRVPPWDIRPPLQQAVASFVAALHVAGATENVGLGCTVVDSALREGAGGECLNIGHKECGEARGVRGDTAVRHGQPAAREAGIAAAAAAGQPRARRDIGELLVQDVEGIIDVVRDVRPSERVPGVGAGAHVFARERPAATTVRTLAAIRAVDEQRAPQGLPQDKHALGVGPVLKLVRLVQRGGVHVRRLDNEVALGLGVDNKIGLPGPGAVCTNQEPAERDGVVVALGR